MNKVETRPELDERFKKTSHEANEMCELIDVGVDYIQMVMHMSQLICKHNRDLAKELDRSVKSTD